MPSPLFLLGSKLLSNGLHHLQLFWIGKIAGGRSIAQNIRAYVYRGAIDKTLLHILKHLTGDSPERCELWVGLAVLANNLVVEVIVQDLNLKSSKINDGNINLVPQYSCQLSQGFKVSNVDDERAKAVIEDEAETLQEFSQSRATFFFILQTTKKYINQISC